MELVYRSGTSGHLSRPRDFTPLSSSESESKITLQDNTTIKPVSTVKPISQKSSSTEIESQSTSDNKKTSAAEIVKKPSNSENLSSSEVEPFVNPTRTGQERMTGAIAAEPEGETSEVQAAVNFIPVPAHF